MWDKFGIDVSRTLPLNSYVVGVYHYIDPETPSRGSPDFVNSWYQ